MMSSGGPFAILRYNLFEFYVKFLKNLICMFSSLFFFTMQQGYFGSPIRCILIKDNARDGSDGYATVQSGGVNQRQVVIYFKSHHSRDIDFNIEIYGDARHWWILFGKTEFETWNYKNQGNDKLKKEIVLL